MKIFFVLLPSVADLGVVQLLAFVVQISGLWEERKAPGVGAGEIATALFPLRFN